MTKFDIISLFIFYFPIGILIWFSVGAIAFGIYKEHKKKSKKESIKLLNKMYYSKSFIKGFDDREKLED